MIVEERDNPFFRCGRCGFTRYNNPLPSTVAVIESEGKILLLQRAVPPQIGTWDAVGGFLAPNETAEECLIREAREEIGVDIVIHEFLGSHTSVYGSTGLNTIGLAFKCSIAKRAEIKLSGENLTMRWFHYEELPQLAFSDVQKAIASWVSRKNRVTP